MKKQVILLICFVLLLCLCMFPGCAGTPSADDVAIQSGVPEIEVLATSPLFSSGASVPFGAEDIVFYTNLNLPVAFGNTYEKVAAAMPDGTTIWGAATEDDVGTTVYIVGNMDFYFKGAGTSSELVAISWADNLTTARGIAKGANMQAITRQYGEGATVGTTLQYAFEVAISGDLVPFTLEFVLKDGRMDYFEFYSTQENLRIGTTAAPIE